MAYTLIQARGIVKISKGNNKMPESTFNVDAKRCNVGGKLVKKKGTVCSKCYWLRIQNFRKNVDEASKWNYDQTVYYLNTDPDAWVKSVVKQIQGVKYHRWFDGGDLINEKMLAAIIEVAKQTPDTKHWVPTKEVKLVKNYKGEIPDNITVRVSAPNVDQKPLKGFNTTSTVTSDETKYEGHLCPSSKQGNKCLDCRACWSKDVKNVTYIFH